MIHTHWTFESMNLVDFQKVKNLSHTDSRKGQVVAEGWESSDLQIDCSRHHVDDYSAENDAIKMVPTGTERGSSSVQYEESGLERQRRVIGCKDDEPVSLHEKETFLWLNDYRCSICGIELPPCLIYERQEHFDFHLAERLQEEESSNVLRIPKPRKRLIHEDHKVIHGRQKKESKASPSKGTHIPTDMFFVKNKILINIWQEVSTDAILTCEIQSMRITNPLNHPVSPFPPQKTLISIQNTQFPIQKRNPARPQIRTKSSPTQNRDRNTNNHEIELPTMSEIIEASRAHNLDLQLRTFGPFFRITATSLLTNRDLGRAEGVVRVWFRGKILHLDSMKLQKETIGMEKSIFGIGLFLGAVAIRHGYDGGCSTAELLAINDTDLYHSKLVKFYTRLGFKKVYEVRGESLEDLSHMLVWGGVGTRMDADIRQLMIKWCTRFKKNI